ncbi:MAG TPA: ROK family protein [Bryobacteraceae bacterium]|nr:ROK family protein [Bryobacteraceae bacterium]
MAARSIGLVVSEHIASGIVENGGLAGTVHVRFKDEEGQDLLHFMPAEQLVGLLAEEAVRLAAEKPVEAIGMAFPGIVRFGVIQDSPNLPQIKGLDIDAAMRAALEQRGMKARLTVSNDADAVAAGIAATHDSLDRLIRVWTLGVGIGFGHYPESDGVWEGGHTVVSLDPNEHFCGCGGRGHLEGIMGHRAMRLRFLDREPDEVFAAAKTGADRRCVEFVELWHRALAAATATSIHLEGPGKFYITGMHANFVNLAILNTYMQEMVKLSPLLSYVFEIVERNDELAVIGAAVNSLRN